MSAVGTHTCTAVSLVELVVVSRSVVWLLGFYTLFHCGLNISAELLRFDDRKFFSGAHAAVGGSGFLQRTRYALTRLV